MKSTRLPVTTALAVVFLGATALALFTNGDFESGDFTGWTKSQFRNDNGLQGAQPSTGASIQRVAGGEDRTSVVGPLTPLTGTDPLVSAVHYPRFGSYAARVNFYNGPATPDRNANSLLQSSTVTAADVDTDGVPHV